MQLVIMREGQLSQSQLAHLNSWRVSQDNAYASASDYQKHNNLSTRSLLTSIYYGHQLLSTIIKSVSNT